MAKGMSLKVLMQLQTKEFRNGLRSIQKQLNGFKTFIKSAFALGSITMFGRELVQVGKDFENAMARVQAVSNATQDEFKRMTAEAQKLGSTTRYTATEAANALENLTRNGMTAANATKALADVLKLAQANSVGLAEAADIITNTLNMFNLGVEQAGRVNDVLSSTASHAATDVTSLYEAMVNAAPAANVLGFSIEEVSSAIGALAQRGVKGSEAGTKLRIAFQKMADHKVIAKMKEQGIEIDETTMKSEGLLKTVQKLAKADLSLGELGKIFDAKSAMAVQMLTASLGDLSYMLDVTANSAGETERMFNQSVGSVQQELDTLKSMYEGLLITISQKTSGAVKTVVRLLQNLITNFETVGGTIMNIASVAVPLLASRVIQLGVTIRGAINGAAASMAALRASMGGIISLVATLVTWVGTALVGAWNRAHKAMKDAKKSMDEADISAGRMRRNVKDIAELIGDGKDEGTLNSAIKKATELFPEFADAINRAKEVARNTSDFENLKSILEDIAELQGLIAQRKSLGELYDAQTQKNGNTLYNATKSKFVSSFLDAFESNLKRGFHLGAGGGGHIALSNEFGHEFKKYLKDSGFSEDKIRAILTDVADAWTKGLQSRDEKYIDKTIEEFKRDGYSITSQNQVDAANETLSRESNALRKASEVISNFAYKFNTNDLDIWLKSNLGGYASADNEAQFTQRTIAHSDSTIVSKNFKILQEDVENSLKLIEKNDRESNIKRYEIAKKFLDDTNNLGLSSNSPEHKIAEELYNKYAKYKPNPGGGGGGGGSSTKAVKTDADYVKDAIDDYNEAKTKLDNRLAAGTITTKDYEEELKRLEDKTWETITAFSNFESILEKLGQTAAGADLKNRYGENRASERHEELFSVYGNLAKYLVPGENSRPAKEDKEGKLTQEVVDVNFNYRDSLNQMISDLESAIENGDFDMVRGDAIEVLNKLRDAAKEASEQADNLQVKLNLSEVIEKLDDEIKKLQTDSITTFTTFAQAMDRVLNSLMGIAEIFDEDLRDSPMYKAYEAFTGVLNSGIQAIQATMSAIELITQLQDVAAKKKVKDSALEVAANEMAATSEMKKAAAEASAAAAGGASAVASIPYVGPVLAVAAIGTIVAALLSAFSKFENGGIVGGSSFTGDKNIVRANSGELILNRHQQATLWNMINGKGGVGNGGTVQFRIRGSDLIGAIDNEIRKQRG